jgi:hypothetical protein
MEEAYELDPFYEAVGRVAAADAIMDSMLAGLYAKLLESPVAEHVAHGQSFDVVTSAIRAILNVSTEYPDHELLVDALNKARELHGRRNLVVHAVWFGVAGMPEVMETLRARRWRPEPDIARWTLTELRELAESLLDHAWHLYDLEQRIGGWH